MGIDGIKAFTCDTGGTVLDWHSGFRDAFAQAGARHGIERDWAALTNALRARSLGAMLNLGKSEPPAYNFDGAHRFTLDGILAEQGLDMFDEADRHAIAWEAPHSFACWPDCPKGIAAMRARVITVSFTILSYRLIVDSARKNGISWDAVLSCEGFGVYKVLPEAYRKAAAALQLEPRDCCMVACHGFDLDAARAVGFRTALVRRPDEWGEPGPPEGVPRAEGGYDVEVDSFIELADALG